MYRVYTNVRTSLVNRYNFIPRIHEVLGRTQETSSIKAITMKVGEHSILIKYRALIY